MCIFLNFNKLYLGPFFFFKVSLTVYNGISAGHVYGDPCEFGLLSINETLWSRKLTKAYGEQHAKDNRLCQGIGSSFVWLVAQAYNQGENICIDTIRLGHLSNFSFALIQQFLAVCFCL